MNLCQRQHTMLINISHRIDVVSGTRKSMPLVGSPRGLHGERYVTHLPASPDAVSSHFCESAEPASCLPLAE